MNECSILCGFVFLMLYQHFCDDIQYIPRNMRTVFALLCFVVVIHWLIFPYPSGLLHWHCGNLTIAPVPAKQPWWIWINTSCEFIMNDCITTTKQSTTKPCANFLGYTVSHIYPWYAGLLHWHWGKCKLISSMIKCKLCEQLSWYNLFEWCPGSMLMRQLVLLGNDMWLRV